MNEAFEKYIKDTGLVGKLDALNESIDDIRKDIASKEVFIAFVNDVAVGTLRVEVLSDNTAYLSRFGVSVQYHNIGIGKSLMNLVDKFAKTNGLKKVSLHTASKYVELVRFYYGRGFYVESTSIERGYIRALMIKEYELQ